VVNRPAFIATRFNQAMKGFGTDEARLLSLIVRFRHPVFMGQVKKEYLRLYGQELATHIQNETSGDFKRSLVEVLN
jgi:hypothetical protein